MTSTHTTERQETGGPDRTPRAEIVPVVSGSRKKEPVLLLDLSGSMDWSAEDENDPAGEWPSVKSRRSIVIEALPGLVLALEGEDTEAAAEQAGGDDEKGGLLTFGFATNPTEIGDLNSSNLKRRLNEIAWGGGTYVVPALQLAIADYDEEFGDRDADEQPVHLVLILTDGTADDAHELVRYLEKANAKRVYVVAIVGHGKKASATAAEYRAAAQRNQAQDKFGKSHITVVNFDGVTDPREIGEDLVTLAV